MFCSCAHWASLVQRNVHRNRTSLLWGARGGQWQDKALFPQTNTQVSPTASLNRTKKTLAQTLWLKQQIDYCIKTSKSHSFVSASKMIIWAIHSFQRMMREGPEISSLLSKDGSTASVKLLEIHPHLCWEKLLSGFPYVPHLKASSKNAAWAVSGECANTWPWATLKNTTRTSLPGKEAALRKLQCTLKER